MNNSCIVYDLDQEPYYARIVRLPLTLLVFVSLSARPMD